MGVGGGAEGTGHGDVEVGGGSVGVDRGSRTGRDWVRRHGSDSRTPGSEPPRLGERVSDGSFRDVDRSLDRESSPHRTRSITVEPTRDCRTSCAEE